MFVYQDFWLTSAVFSKFKLYFFKNLKFDAYIIFYIMHKKTSRSLEKHMTFWLNILTFYLCYYFKFCLLLIKHIKIPMYFKVCFWYFCFKNVILASEILKIKCSEMYTVYHSLALLIPYILKKKPVIWSYQNKNAIII